MVNGLRYRTKMAGGLKRLCYFVLMGICVVWFTHCTSGRYTASLPPAPQETPPSSAMDIDQTALPEQNIKDARMRAAQELTVQAKQLLDENKEDEAITVLEKAVSLYPGGGEHYYYLAEAWLTKGNQKQALECNRLAGIHTSGDMDWALKVAVQKARIEDLDQSPHAP